MTPQISTKRLPNLPAKMLAKAVLPLPLGLCVIWMFAQRLAEVDLSGLPEALRSLPIQAWLISCLLTCISFGALSRYDLVAHKTLRTNIGPARSMTTGAAATAMAQTLGFGILVGSAARWRLLRNSDLDAPRAFALTGLVTGGFLAGWAVLTMFMVLAFPPLQNLPEWWTGRGQWITLAGLCLILALSAIRAKTTLYGITLRAPSLRALCLIVCLALIDTLAAAGALYVFIPSSLAPSFPLFFTAFLIALGCGVIAGTPMGIGAFELTLIAMLPEVPVAPLLTAIIAFRAIYYIAPASLAAIWLAMPQPTLSKRPVSGEIRDPIAQLSNAHEGRVLLTPAGEWCARALGPLTVTLGDAALPPPQMQLSPLTAHYKITGKTASALRCAGWYTSPISSEAIITPQSFQLDCPQRRGLRRKLRKAEKAGITIECAESYTLTKAQQSTLARINAAWARHHGGERGFAIGRFCTDLLNAQRVYMAKNDGQVIAFITFHTAGEAWMLDMIRHDETLPDGCIYALTLYAINDAAKLGVKELSLDCVPGLLPPRTPGLFAKRIAPRIRAQSEGLYRFKIAFAPNWRIRHYAARNIFGFVLGALASWVWVKQCRKIP